jgi:endonuclease G
MFKRVVFIIVISFVFTALLLYVFYPGNKNTPHQLESKITESSVNTLKSKGNFYLLPKQTANQIVHYSKFSLSYNENTEQADWVAYRLYPNSVNNGVKRKNNFRNDHKIATASASLSDYRGSGYDRGHLAPAKAMSFDEQSMSESFLMSNMSPQLPTFNRGIWKKLEGKVRDLATISDSLYVVTGPILDENSGSIGTNKVLIPNAYYKAILRFRGNEFNGIGFLLKHEKSSRKVTDFTVSIDSIETITGLNFFYLLDSVQQQKVESNNSYQEFVKKTRGQ